MASHRSPGRGHGSSDDRRPVSDLLRAHERLRTVLLLGTYGLALVAVGAAVLGGALDVGRFAPPLVAVLAVWGIGLAGAIATQRSLPVPGDA